MTTQEEWRQLSYERHVGETGNNSIGTMANQQGYQTFLENQKASQQQYHSDLTAAWSGGSVNNGSPDYYASPSYSGSGNVMSAVDHIAGLLPKRLSWLLALLGAMATCVYVAYTSGEISVTSSEAFLDRYTGPVILGFIAGRVFIPLLVFVVKLVISALLIAAMLAVAASVLYLVIMFVEYSSH